MNLVKSKTISIKVKSTNHSYIDFDEKNPIVNLDLIVSFQKVDLGIAGIPTEIPSIRFNTSNLKHISWYFRSSEERDECFNNIERQSNTI